MTAWGAHGPKGTRPNAQAGWCQMRGVPGHSPTMCCRLVRRQTFPFGGGGAYSFFAGLSDLTIDHASRSRHSTVPTSNQDTSNRFGAHHAFPTYYVKLLCLHTLFAFCFAFYGEGESSPRTIVPDQYYQYNILRSCDHHRSARLAA